jgi:hypothetical protein
MQVFHQRSGPWKFLAIEGELEFLRRERDLVLFIQVFGVFGIAELSFITREGLRSTPFKEGTVCLSHLFSNGRTFSARGR